MDAPAHLGASCVCVSAKDQRKNQKHVCDTSRATWLGNDLRINTAVSLILNNLPKVFTKSKQCNYHNRIPMIIFSDASAVVIMRFYSNIYFLITFSKYVITGLKVPNQPSQHLYKK